MVLVDSSGRAKDVWEIRGLPKDLIREGMEAFRPKFFQSLGRYKGDLGIDDLGDEIMVAFGEYFDLSLPGCLGHEMIALPRDLQDDLRRQLIAAHVAVEYFRIDLRRVALLRGKHHASAVSKDMQIRRDLLRRRAIDIREHDYREFVVGIVGQHRIEAFYSASVRNFFVATRGAYAQAKSVDVFEWRGHLL